MIWFLKAVSAISSFTGIRMKLIAEKKSRDPYFVPEKMGGGSDGLSTFTIKDSLDVRSLAMRPPFTKLLSSSSQY